MASLMSLTRDMTYDLVLGNWVLICKTADKHGYLPQWKLLQVHGRYNLMTDRLELANDEVQTHLLQAISGLDHRAQLVQREHAGELIPLKSYSIKSLCRALRTTYERQTGLSLKTVLAQNSGGQHGTETV